MLRKRAGDRDALLLTAGELVRAGPGAVDEADGVQAAERQLAVRAREAARDHAPGGHVGQAADQHVLERGQPADQIELLEDQRELAAREPELSRTLPDVAAGDGDRAAGIAAPSKSGTRFSA